MKKIITYGTFDLFHYGHYNLLKRAKQLGDYLIVGVSSDEMCIAKGKVPFLSQEKRIEIVSNLRFVDEVIVENNMEQKVKDVIQNGINSFVLGDDYKDIFPKMREYELLANAGCEIVFLPRTPEISSSALKQKIIQQNALDKDKDSLHNITNKLY